MGRVGRHGKFLTMPLDDGQTMVAHLGMSGRFSLPEAGAPLDPHTHLVVHLDDGQEVRFVDPRTFGFVAVFDEDELLLSPLARLGPDAWDRPLSPSELKGSFRGRTAPIKALLLDQGLVAGLGNIYADESLHQARIHPLRPGGRLSEATAARLVEAIRNVLQAAIASGGTTLSDLAYLLPDGQAGDNLESLAVYGREGLPCRSCGSPVRRVVVRARSTHYCPSCQR